MTDPEKKVVLGPRPPKPVIECRTNDLHKTLGTFAKDGNSASSTKKSKDK